ncbi:MAG: ABC transporter ATP-binding protein [Fimbriimonadaceae bacterium]
MLSAHTLGKRYGDRWIFRGVSFELELGQCLVVSGNNGSGKSTLVKCLTGLILPSEGTVSSIRSIGYAAIELQPYANLTAREHLELFSKMKGCAPAVTSLLEKVGLQEATDVAAGQMSTGMKARLKLALALQGEPETLILDEPGASLDEGGRELLDQICIEQKQRGTLIIATNDPLEKRWGTHEIAMDA